MLPTLCLEATLDSTERDFVARLASSGFTGDIDTGYATRLTLATDNSAFQQLPGGALFPRDETDIQRVARLLAEPEFHAVYIAPRGGGTSTIGCSLTAGFVVDCSRHMNRIISIDAEAREAVVESGVVLDQLNDALAEHDLFFAPNVAPSSRATLGGMLNTDGCGKGSRIFGKTSDHVLATHAVLADGETHIIDARPDAPQPDAFVQTIADEVATVVAEHQAEIDRVFPKLSRYLSGYNLAQAVAADGRARLNKLIGGSEGTLALISQLTLKLTPLPNKKVLFALRYPSFDAALRDAQRLVEYDPGAIESVDETVMRLARDNPIYERVREYIENDDGSTPGAVNLVEFSGVDDLPKGAARLGDALQTGDNGASGYYRADTANAQAALWDLRKAGVGLLGSTPGARKPLPFVEDTVVDPSVLADYVADFRAILDEHGVSYGMFGHIDVGCLHVRPALDLIDPADEARMRDITTRVRHLAESYGGLLWNEHGKGFRSEYNRPFFGEPLYAALGRIKRAFDPRNQLNPGKIVAIDPSRFPLATMDAPTRGTFDRQIDSGERAAFPGAMNCNGNGACFDYDPAHVMCPSYRATRDRLHSPKGRASAMREWLRQLAVSGHSTADLAPADSPLWLRAVRDGSRNDRLDPEADFSHQVWQAMDGCLSCRACANQCPIRVDVPAFKSQFLALYHGRYARPPADYALAGLETGARLAARLPRLANAVLGLPVTQRLLARHIGMVDPPALSRPSLTAWLRHRPGYRYSPDGWSLMDPAERERAVFVVQDAFTSFFDAPAVIAVIELIAALGYRPQVAPFVPSGKPLQVKGFAPEFERTAQKTARRIEALIDHERPLVGVEPSVTRALDTDYCDAIGRAMPVVAFEHWLADALADRDRPLSAGTGRYRLLNHCTARTDSSASNRDWQAVFDALGASLEIADVGCCGMSGAYGHEARHRDTSAAIFDLSWSAALAGDGVIPVVPGYSCRSQIKRLDGLRVMHPARLVLDRLADAA